MISDRQLQRLMEHIDVTPNVLDVDCEPFEKGDKVLKVADAEMRALCQQVIDLVPDMSHLHEAKILVMTESGWKADADGRLELGHCAKSNPIVRMLAKGCDFVVTLNADAWEFPAFDKNPAAATETAKANHWRFRAALMDHELMHAGYTIAGAYIPPGEVKAFAAALGRDHIETCTAITDEDNRILVRYVKRQGRGVKPGEDGYGDQPRAWRIRKHDIEEFNPVLQRWGVWKSDIQHLVHVIEELRHNKTELVKPAGETAA